MYRYVLHFVCVKIILTTIDGVVGLLKFFIYLSYLINSSSVEHIISFTFPWEEEQGHISP